MTPERGQELEDLFAALVELDPPQREARLQEMGERDPELAREVRSLLAADEQAGDVLGVFEDPEAHRRFDGRAMDRPEDGNAAGEEERVLGDYRLVREIGHGGMGTVFQAIQQSVGRTVALKVLPGSFGLDPERVERFRREARATARIRHQNIVPLYEFGEAEGTLFYSMEFIDGPSLDQMLDAARKGGTKKERRDKKDSSTSDPAYISNTVERMAELAEGLVEAHELGLVHRDVKPSNIIVDRSGRWVLVDFGLVHDEEVQTITRSGEMLGTVRYMSPEQVARKKVDARSDVYSLAVTLYEALTLGVPFDGASHHEVQNAILLSEPPSPRKLNPRVNRDLETSILHALEKNPDRRYPSAGALAADLRRLLRLEPIRARPQPFLRKVRRHLARHRTRVVAAAAVLMALLAVAVVSSVRTRGAQRAVFDRYTASGLEATHQMNLSRALLWFGRAASVPHGDAERESSNRVRLGAWLAEAPFPAGALFLEGRSVTGIEFHPRGSHLLILGPEDHCVLWNRDEEAASPLPGGDGPVSAAAWSPDGDLLALGRPGGAVDLLSFPEGRALHRLHGSPGRASALAFSPDGRLLAIANDHARIWDRQRQGFAGDPVSHPAPVRWLTFGPRGDRLLTAAADDRARVFAVSASGLATGPLFAPVPHLTNYRIAGLTDSEFPWLPVLVDGGRGLLTVTTPTEVTWWDGGTGAEKHRISAVGRLAAVLPSPDGRWVALVDAVKAQLWDIVRERREETVLEPSGRFPVAAWSPDSSSFFLGGEDRQIRGWDFVPRKANRTFQLEARRRPTIPHHAGVVCMAASPGGELLATAQADGLVRLFCTKAESPPRRGHLPPSMWHQAIASSPDGRHVMSRGGHFLRPRTSTRVFEVATAVAAGPPLLTAGTLLDSGFSPAGARVHTIAGSTSDRDAGEGRFPGAVIEFWDWRSGERISQIAAGSTPTHWRYSDDGSRLAVRFAGGRVVVVDPVAGRAAGGAEHLHPEPGFTFAPGGEHFITWTPGDSPRIWTTATGEERRPALEREVRSRWIRFSEDGSLVITVSVDHAVEVWDFSSGRLLSPELRHRARILFVDLEDEKLLAAGADQTVRLWNWRSGQPIAAPLEHRSVLHGAAFLGLHRGWIVTLTWADGLRVWEASTARLLAPPTKVSIDRAVPFFFRLHPSQAGVLSVSEARTGGQLVPSREVRVDGAIPLSLAGGLALLAPFEVHDLSDLSDHRKDRTLGAGDWERLGALLSGEAIGEGGSVHLGSEEWVRLWRQFRREHPQRFPPASRQRTLAWHRARAAALAGEQNWDAASWHLDRLGNALGREDRRVHARVRSYVRRWQFAPRAFSWQGADARALDPLEPEALAAITESAMAARPVRARGPYVDFVTQYPEHASLGRGYALRAIRSPEPRRIRILAGSDDTLRLWLNGNEVFASPELGPAVPDHCRVDVDLVRGENTLLVEVGQSGGDWGLYLRLEDAGGRRLYLGADGLLQSLLED